MNDIYSMFSVEHKKILITGAAHGNGKIIAKALGEAGGELCLVDIDGMALDGVANKIEAKTGKVACKAIVDLSDISMLDGFLEQHNDFDVVINNAGVTRGNNILDYDDADWDLTYKVNLYAPFKIIQKISRRMITKKSGSIINVTSLAAEVGFPGNPAYVAFKGALKQLTKSAACDLSEYGIRVNSVGPGYIRTNMTKNSWYDQSLRRERSDRMMLNRWGESDDLIGIMIYLASDASSYVTGQDFYIDGGWLSKGL